MKRIMPFFLIIFFAAGIFAQGTITVTVTSSEAGSGLTEIEYEFSGPAGAYNISAKVDFGDDEGFLSIPGDHLSGDVTKVEPGIRSFIWDGMASFPERYSDETIVEVTATQVCGDTYSVTFTYNGTDVTYGTVWRGGLCWFDRNLGADPMPFVPVDDATGNTDTRLYGDLFQWGRLDDGHQDRSSTTTSTLSPTDVPRHSDFITNSVSPNDWRDPQYDGLWQGVEGINNPCPPGWRVPTEPELNAERQSWSSNNPAGAYASTLKWPVGGYRASFGVLFFVGSRGFVWSSSVSGANARYLVFESGNANMASNYRADGMSVRCVREP